MFFIKKNLKKKRKKKKIYKMKKEFARIKKIKENLLKMIRNFII